MTEFIISAAGHASRWGGVDKCLLELNGERLVDRTVRLLNERGIEPVVVRREDQQGSWPRMAEPELSGCGVDKFLHAVSLWQPRTFILFGDVWYSERAIDSIVRDSMPHRIVWWGRLGEGFYTGKPWGELYAVRFRAPQRSNVFHRACWHVRNQYEKGHLLTCLGWDVREHIYRTCPQHQWLVEINDNTEDFDRPEDLEAWLERNALTAAASTAI
jgi:hypothetical protein